LECNLYDHSSVAELSNRIRQLLTVILWRCLIIQISAVGTSLFKFLLHIAYINDNH
jgi:hypothetical protein